MLRTKKNILILFLVTIVTFCACSKESDYLFEIQKQIDSEYYIINYVEGNFISKNEKSIIVFLDKKENRNASPNAEKKLVYMIENNKIKFFTEITQECCYVDTRFIDLDTSKSILGQVYPFGWVGDFNDNGITELMFCQSSRTEEGATIEFVEFQDGRFKTILPAQNDICRIKNIYKESHSMELRRSKYSSEIDDYIVKKSKIVWNAKTEMYDEIPLD